MTYYASAVADFSRALEINPDSALALARRGETYLMLGSHDEGVADLDRAIEIDPDIAPGMADRLVPTALVRLREGEPEKAAEIFKAVISVSPAAADPHNNYAFCLLPIDPLHAFE